jgi:hypothetical protein
MWIGVVEVVASYYAASHLAGSLRLKASVRFEVTAMAEI